jgi:hypothetical protein
MSALKTTNKKLPIHPDKLEPQKYHHRQSSLLEPSLEDFTKLHPAFTSLGFRTFLLQNKVFSLASNPEARGPDHCIYVPQ